MEKHFVGHGGVFYWTGFYLGPYDNHMDSSWMDKRSELLNIGYSIAPLYVGESNHSSTLTYNFGHDTAGPQAAGFASTAGFDDVVIFLDIEGGSGEISAGRQDYIEGWLDYMDSSPNFWPGIYCSYQNADLIKSLRPDMIITWWVYRFFTLPGCCTNTGSDTPATSTVGYADIWHYARNCDNFSIPPGGGRKNLLDLDLSWSADPAEAPE